MARLPDLPKGKEFEEYISACFQSGGYYVERNIIERIENEEILELDSVATRYEKNKSDSLIIEAKSGAWGFSDIFKIKGWLDYLKCDRGILIANSAKEDTDFYKKKAKEIGVKLIQLNEEPKVKGILKELEIDCELENKDLNSWRFSYWLERNLLKFLKEEKKCNYPRGISYQKLDQYYFLLNSEIFFSKTILDRVCKLYEIYQKFPRISTKCGNELIGNAFEDEIDKLPEAIYSSTYYDCEFNIIQVSTFIEHRARLAILKSAIDYLLVKDFKLGVSEIDIQTNDDRTLINTLPETFRKGMEGIEKHDYFYRYPVFWQWFMWFFGGFILKDYQEQEYEILARKTGIPTEEVPNALKAYELLFPQEDGWFHDLSPRSNILILKMFSMPFRGLGAHYRRITYTDTGKYKDLKVDGQYTHEDLRKWHDLTAEVLRR